MAFADYKSGFSRAAGGPGGNAPTIWVYKSGDALTAIDAAGYFNAVADRVKVGDFIDCYTSSGPGYGRFVVNANSRDLAASPPVSGVVDVSNATAFGTIDSD